MEDDIAQILKHNSLDLHSEEQNLGKKAVGGETKARTGGRTLEKILRTSFVNPAHWFLKGERACAVVSSNPRGGAAHVLGNPDGTLRQPSPTKGARRCVNCCCFGTEVR